MRNIYGKDGYGKERLQPFDGVSLFSQMKAICQLKRADGSQPRPIVKFSGTTAKVRLVTRALALVTRRKQG